MNAIFASFSRFGYGLAFHRNTCYTCSLWQTLLTIVQYLRIQVWYQIKPELMLHKLMLSAYGTDQLLFPQFWVPKNSSKKVQNASPKVRYRNSFKSAPYFSFQDKFPDLSSQKLILKLSTINWDKTKQYKSSNLSDKAAVTSYPLRTILAEFQCYTKCALI